MKSPDIKKIDQISGAHECTFDMHQNNIRKPHEHAPVHRHACRTSAKYIQISTFIGIAWVSFSSKDPRRTMARCHTESVEWKIEVTSQIFIRLICTKQKKPSKRLPRNAFFWGYYAPPYSGSSHLSPKFWNHMELQYKQ